MSVMDLRSVLASFRTGYYTVFRPASTSYDTNGRIEDPTYDTFADEPMCIQPTSGADLRRLPQGLQTDEIKTIWCEFAILLRDRVVIGGASWEVQRVEPWNELGGYWRAFVTKLNQN